MKQKKSFLLVAISCITILCSKTLLSKDSRFESIGDGYLFSLRHYPKFYGDVNTSCGNIFERSYLLGSFGGHKRRLAENGIYVDMTIFQFWGANLTGGAKHGFLRYNGNAEYWLVIDTGKANLWSRGALMLHAETSWVAEDSINDDVGSILASNSRSRVPVPEEPETTLSEVAYAQIVSDYFSFRVGKLDATGPIDATNFANNSRFQFSYAGLVNNPIISHFTSYTSPGILPMLTLNKKNKILLFIADAQGEADESGLDSMFNGKTAYCVQYVFSPHIGRKFPGNYRVMYAYSKKPLTQYELDERHLIGKDVREITIPIKCQNYALLVNFDQYLWVHEDNDSIPCRSYRPPVGILLFGRAGWEPKDRNVIDQFYSIGIGSYGGFKNRYYDQWGIGYAATHISCNLRRDLKKRNVTFNKFEHAIEVFYNMELTPALHFTLNAQVIRPPLRSRDAAFVISSRLQADF